MTAANIVEIKNHFSHYLDMVVNGEPVQICKRNVAIAQIVPLEGKKRNRTKLGCGSGTVGVAGDLTEPAMDSGDWNMLGGTP
ncbi:MAG: type II toxin-antitoxin system prevent-host-death family antitoxin [Verrucomicrobiota bacterium]